MMHDPYFAQGVSSLMKAFAPPSAQEVYAGAKAQETKAKLGQMAEMFDLAKSPSFDQSRFDRLGVAGGVFTPSQSYYAVDRSNDTSRANNLADNQRALVQTGMQQEGETTRSLLTPVSAGATRFVPKSIASAFALPEMQMGAVNAGQGDTVYAPNGAVYRGAAKPLSEAEAKGQIIAGLSPAERRALALGSTPVEPVVGADGAPQLTWRADSIGKRPYDKPSGQPQTSNYRTPDGTTGTAVYDPILGWKDTQTGAALPQGVSTYDLKAQGSVSDIGVGPTTANQTEANRLGATIDSTSMLLDQYEKLLKTNPGVAGAPGGIRGMAQDLASSAGELAAAFGNAAPGAAVTLNDIQNLARQVSANRDPAIQLSRSFVMSLAYADAQLNNPTGEVSRQAFERSLEKIQGGMLANNQSALEGVQGMRIMLDAKRQQVQSLRRPNGGVAQASAVPVGQAPVANASGFKILEVR
jgi:hypothetical protein